MPSGREDLDTAIDAATFRRVMARYPTGITVITASLGGEPVGMSANSFTSLSLDPPLVLFCPALTSSTWPKIEAAGHFAVNIMPKRAEAVSRRFAVPGIDRFEGLGYRSGRTGAPVLEDACAHLECQIHAVHEGGDHVIVVGWVVDLAEGVEEPPLIFYGSEYYGLDFPEDSS